MVSNIDLILYDMHPSYDIPGSEGGNNVVVWTVALPIKTLANLYINGLKEHFDCNLILHV